MRPISIGILEGRDWFALMKTHTRAKFSLCLEAVNSSILMGLPIELAANPMPFSDHKTLGRLKILSQIGITSILSL